MRILSSNPNAGQPVPPAVPASFENINLLRAFAALSVVVYHVIEHGNWSSFPVTGPLLTFRLGWMGVDLFFVISGFVITHSALALYRKDEECFFGDYWRRRLTRIAPLYLLTMALWIATFGNDFLAAPADVWAWQLLTHLTFTHSFFYATHSAIDGVNWTIAIEMQFYLAVSLLIPWIRKTPGWRIWLYGILVACSWRAAMFILYGDIETFLTFMRATQFPGCLDEFGAGIFLAKCVIDRPVSTSKHGFLWLMLAPVTGYVAMRIFWVYSSYWQFPGMVILWHVALSVFLLCVVAAAVQLSGDAPPRPRAYGCGLLITWARSVMESIFGTSSRCSSSSITWDCMGCRHLPASWPRRS
jgi:peptidoglycan/LPS O-acetylase OafA/YrhL